MTARHWGITMGAAAVAWAAIGESTAAAIFGATAGLVFALAALKEGA